MKVLGIAGYSGSGKTTLIEQMIPRLIAAGLRVSLIKHAHHDFDIDQPGKDSYRHRQAGASEVMISSDQRWALMHELGGEREPALQDQLKLFSPCDLILVEGYKREPIPKLEVHRRGNDLLHPQDDDIFAIATDHPIESRLPILDLNDYDAIVNFLIRHLELA